MGICCLELICKMKMSKKATYKELEERIKELEKENQALKKEAGKGIRDALTGLYNRHFYNDNIELIIKETTEKKQEVGFLMIDIDKFKYLNDNFGHLKGDELLQRLARIIDSSIKNNDYSIRWGGEEILVILSNANGNTGQRVVSRIEDKINKYNKHNKIEKYDEKKKKHIKYEFSVSAGYALRSYLSKEPVEATIELADKRMYKQKKWQN